MTGGGSIEIRRVRAGESEQLRELRLRAMAEAAYAFSSWHERELGRPDAFWRRLARESEESLTSATFVAVHGERWVGLAGVFVEDGDAECGYVWGTWVAGEARRRGVARALMGAIRDWAGERGLNRLRLSVSDSPRSDPARRLYESLGFTPTGEEEPMASDPALRAHEMALRLR